MQAPVCLAQEMGRMLVICSILFRTMSTRRRLRAARALLAMRHRNRQADLFGDESPPAIVWLPQRQYALEQISAFAPRAGRLYAAQRNFDHGPGARSNVSLLSPWIRHRILLESEVLETVLSHASPVEAEKFIQEVFWRGYFKGWLQHYPQVWDRYRRDTGALIDTLDVDHTLATDVEAATSGKTGIACFDSWAQELITTGYLHNHARMWFASIWMFTLRLPWQLGADFFYRHLLDGDPASNTLSWRWVAGLHTKGKTYLARADNIEKYTGKRFRPGDELATEALALEEPPVGPPRRLAQFKEPPIPQEYGWLVSEEDCAPETFAAARSAKAALGLNTVIGRSPLAVTDQVHTFTRELISDALDRLNMRYGVPVSLSESNHWAEAITAWARSCGIEVVVTPFAPVGPVAEALAHAQPVLHDHGIRLVQLHRKYDAAVWPHAKKGFFALKKQIPAILRALELKR